MKIVLSSESLKGYGLNRIFGFAKEAGYDGIDLAMDPSEHDTMDENYIKQISDQTGLHVGSIQTPKTTTKNHIEDAISLAKKIGTKIIIIQPPKLLNVKLAKWLRDEIPKIRQRENISIALENASSETIFGFLPEHAMGSIGDLKKFKHVCLDTSRIAQKKEDLIRFYESIKKYLVHIHVSNFYKGKAYAPPEMGVLPLESFLSKLKQDDFKGSISIKVRPQNFHVGDDQRMLSDIKASLEYCKKYVGDTAI